MVKENHFIRNRKSPFPLQSYTKRAERKFATFIRFYYFYVIKGTERVQFSLKMHLKICSEKMRIMFDFKNE